MSAVEVDFIRLNRLSDGFIIELYSSAGRVVYKLPAPGSPIDRARSDRLIRNSKTQSNKELCVFMSARFREHSLGKDWYTTFL